MGESGNASKMVQGINFVMTESPINLMARFWMESKLVREWLKNPSADASNVRDREWFLGVRSLMGIK